MAASKQDWLLNTKAALTALRPVAIERKRRPSAAEFLDLHYAANRPVIIEGAFNDWPALTRWSLPYFRRRFGERMVQVQANRDSDPDFETNGINHRTEMTFAAVIDHVERSRRSNDIYIVAGNDGTNKHALSELLDDIGNIDEYLTPNPHQRGFLWFGPAGTITPLHHDLTNNFMAQVMGHKRVYLAPSEASPNVYNDKGVFSQVDFRAVDYEKFPLMRNVAAFDCVIGPGELLFVPIGWWHAVEAMDVSVTITFTNFRWRNDFYVGYPG